MIPSKKGTSIVESMIVMVIVIIGVVGMYNIFIKSQNMSDSSTYRINAIAIAREGIEALTNIRDTNWLVLGANKTNCWSTFNYNSSCIIADGTASNPHQNILSGSYILYKDIDNRWKLNPKTTGLYSSGTYRDDFRVNIDSDGFYTQSGGTVSTGVLFTREIKISYPDASTPPQKMKVESVVRWTDSARNEGNYEIIFDTILTNWKR